MAVERKKGRELNRQGEYVIVDSAPYIPGVQAMDIWKLNSIIDDINAESPNMTSELLALIRKGSSQQPEKGTNRSE